MPLTSETTVGPVPARKPSTKRNKVGPAPRKIVVQPAELAEPRKQAKPRESKTLHSGDAREVAGFPEELIAAMCKVLDDIGGVRQSVCEWAMLRGLI